MKNSVKVFVRVRPRIRREIELDQHVLVEMNEGATVINPPRNASPSKKTQEPKQFQFDSSLWSLDPQNERKFKSQQDCFEICAQEMLEHTLSGYNTCIFAYGQTGSGKSYTMMGNQEDQGIIPRCCEELFDKCTSMPQNFRVQMNVSFFEIYNEQVRDLLSDDPVPLRVRENPHTGPYVEGLQSFQIQTVDHFANYMTVGNKNRTTGATKMNDQSSRSHAVFTITIRITEFDTDEQLVRERNSCLRLVDLAGSERVNSTGATGVRFKEGSNINKSLTTLGRVISSLTKNEKPPFRDSALTWLLKESLGGNSKTVMIACISPVDYEETLSTLRYASLVKRIKLDAIINVVDQVESHNEEEFLQLQAEIAQLTTSLSEANAKDKLLAQFQNLNNFFENRLTDQTNQYDLLKMKYLTMAQQHEKVRNDLRSILVPISTKSNLNIMGDLKSQHTELLRKANGVKSQLQQDVENFAP
jgi:hypothetical protein